MFVFSVIEYMPQKVVLLFLFFFFAGFLCVIRNLDMENFISKKLPTCFLTLKAFKFQLKMVLFGGKHIFLTKKSTFNIFINNINFQTVYYACN